MKISIVFFNLSSKDIVLTHDYILDHLFTDYEKETSFLMPDQIGDKKFDVFVYSCRDPAQPCHFGYSPPYEVVLEAVKKIKPKIIIQLSDEFWQEYNDKHNELSNYCELFLREYAHWNQSYNQNTFSIPLGYLNDYPIDLDNVKLMNDRKYFWSWVGFLKSDRQEMINSFLRIWNHICACNGGLSQPEIFDLYSDSKFVPIGRGNSTIDCWRIYEALCAGAIPVIVSNEDEINCAFRYEEIPPFIFASSWHEASEICIHLEQDKDALQEKQNQILNWWKKTISSIKEKINLVFYKHSVTVICACKNRESPLNISLNSWLNCKEISEIIIVDWSSDKSLNYLVDLDERIKVISVPNQVYFNQPEPLNLAARMASSEYILKLDTDYILNPYYNFFEAYKIDEQSFVCGQNDHSEFEINSSPYFKHLRGLLYISKDNYLKVGGYNEVNTKYYAYEDDEIVHRLEIMGLEKKKICYNHSIIHIPHPDKKRLENFEAYHTDKELEENIRNVLSSSYGGQELEWQVEYVLAQQHIEINRQKSLEETKDYYFQTKIEWNLSQTGKRTYDAQKISDGN